MYEKSRQEDDLLLLMLPENKEPIGQVGMMSLQVNCSLAEVNASVFIAVF